MAGRDLFASQPQMGRDLFAIKKEEEDDRRIGGDIPVDTPSPEQVDQGYPGASFIEPAAAMISGAAAEPIAGLAGIAQAVNPFAEEGAGARAVEETREALTYEPRTEEGKAGLQAVGEFLKPVAEAFQGFEKYLGDETFESTKSPALAAAASTIPTAMLEILGLAGAKGTIKATKNIKNANEKAKIKQSIVESAPEIEQLKEVSRGVYKELDDAGVQLKPKVYEGMVNQIKKKVNKKGFDVDVTPATASVIRRLESEVGKTLSLTEIDNLRTVAQNAINPQQPRDAMLSGIIIDSVDDFLDNMSPKAIALTVMSTKEIMPKYQIARELWGRARRSEMINDAFKNARNQASGFENGIVIQFRSILNNKKKAKFFKPREIQAMEQVVRGTTGSNLAKLVGRLGFSEGHATNIIGGGMGVAAGAHLGGPIGAVAVPVAGQLSRKLAQKMTRKNAEMANTVIKAGSNAERIAKAYFSKTKKAERSSAELSELLLRPDIALDRLLVSDIPTIRTAAEIAQGNRALNILTGANVLAAPEIVKEDEDEQ